MIPYEEFKKQFMNGNISVVSERGNRYYWLYGAVAVRTPYAKEIAITRMELSELYSKYVPLLLLYALTFEFFTSYDQ